MHPSRRGRKRHFRADRSRLARDRRSLVRADPSDHHENIIRKILPFRLVLIRKFNTTFVGTGVLDCPQQKNFGRDIVFSADLCYNGTNKKPHRLGSEAARGE